MTFKYPPIDAPSLTAFAPLAKEWCGLIEGHTALGLEELVTRAHSALSRLYVAGLDLPSTELLFTDEDDDEEDVDLEFPADPDRLGRPEWSGYYGSFSRILGKWNAYRETYDPWDPPSEDDVGGHLADDLTDIYVDIKSGLLKWERGDSGGALWVWRFGVETHWGDHATGAIRALHFLRFNRIGEENTNQEP